MSSSRREVALAEKKIFGASAASALVPRADPPYLKARNTDHKVTGIVVYAGPAARIPALAHKPPTRLLAREALKLRQTEFDSAGPVFCLRSAVGFERGDREERGASGS